MHTASPHTRHPTSTAAVCAMTRGFLPPRHSSSNKSDSRYACGLLKAPAVACNLRTIRLHECRCWTAGPLAHSRHGENAKTLRCRGYMKAQALSCFCILRRAVYMSELGRACGGGRAPFAEPPPASTDDAAGSEVSSSGSCLSRAAVTAGRVGGCSRC